MAPLAQPVSGALSTGIIGRPTAAPCCPSGQICGGICIQLPIIGATCIGGGGCNGGGGGVPGTCPPGEERCATPFGVICVPIGTCLGAGPPVVPPGPPPQPGPPQFPPPTNGGRGGCPPRGAAPAKILCPPGCHANKASYFLKGGTFVEEGSRCVTNRRRNPLNPRALDRAAGRLRSAQKAVRFLQAAKIPKKRRR